MDADDARRLALSLPGAEEKSHMGKADFRVRDRIFASLPAPGRVVVKLTVEQQGFMVDAEPAALAPVKGGWGRKGWTVLHLHEADAGLLESVLRTAHANVAPKAPRGRTA